LPHLNRGTNEGLLSLEIHHTTLHEGHLSVCGLRLDNILAILAPWCISAEKGA
jgi:hypothetical protein